MKRAYFNCILLDGTEQMEPVAHKMVLVDGEKITAIVEDTAPCEGYEKVDLKGGYLMPGLINLHVHLAGNGKPSAKPRDNAALVRRILSNGLTRAVAYRRVCSYATLELLGGEEMLGRRAVTPEVAAKVKGIIQRTLDYAAEHNLDIMGANPAPDNIAGGLTTIEEKALGAIKKGGTRPLVEVLEEGERPTKKGFVIMDAPAPGVENLTAIVSGGCHAVIFSTGKGNCIGHPVAPVIKISGNPMTVKSMRDNIDVDVSGVINQGLTLDQVTDIVQDKLADVCWGAMTSSDMLGEIETAASRLLRTL